MIDAAQLETLCDEIAELIRKYEPEPQVACAALMLTLTAILLEDGQSEALAHKLLTNTWKTLLPDFRAGLH